MTQLERNEPLRYGRDTLERVPIFQGLSGPERQQLAQIARTLLFGPGEYVLREGEVEQKLWIVISGQCEVLRSAPRPGQPPVVLAVLDAYENFGEMSFFDRAPHSASVRASTAVELLVIERGDFNALLDLGNQAACKVAINTIRSLSERLRHMDDWVAQLLGHDAAQPRVEEWENFRKKLFNRWTL